MVLYADDAVSLCHEKSKYALKEKLKRIENVKLWVAIAVNFFCTLAKHIACCTPTKANPNSMILF